MGVDQIGDAGGAPWAVLRRPGRGGTHASHESRGIQPTGHGEFNLSNRRRLGKRKMIVVRWNRNLGLSLPPNGAADPDPRGEDDDRSRIRRTNGGGDSSPVVKKIGTTGGGWDSWWRALERFTFASPTCSPQPRIHGLQIIGVFSSRVAATVHSLGREPQDVPKQSFPCPFRAPIGATGGLGHGTRLSPRRGWKRLLLRCLRVLGLTPPGYELSLLRS